MTTDNSIADLVAAKSAEHADAARPILTFVHVDANSALADVTRTYAQLQANADAIAGWLEAHGLRPGDCIAIMMNNHPEFVEAMIAAAILGLIWVPIDARAVGDKLAYMLNHAECRGVVAADYCLDALTAVAPQVASLGWLLAFGDTARAPAAGIEIANYKDALRCPAPAAVAIDPLSPMYLMYTSGTTGNPKAVVHTHGQFMATAGSVAWLGARPGDVLYTGLSLTHINAQGTLRGGLALGLPTVISRTFTKSRLWEICRAYGCTMFTLLGGMIPEVFAAPPRPDDADNPVRLVISAGMPADLWNAYRERFGLEICEVYGATEAGGSMLNPPGGRVGSMGKPDPSMEAAVFDEADRRLGSNEPGELRFRRRDGQPIVVRYYHNDQASADKVKDGWYRTGDVVRYDEDGWFYFLYRIGGGVRRNGDFVNTALVESTISRSPMVDDVYVFGVALPHNVAGEKTLVAMVVPVDPDAFDKTDLLAWCATVLERNDVPEIVHAVDAIPKTASEKPIEREAVAILKRDELVAA
ncbi:MAG: AMP-binding protein [Sphingomonadaceae bacterium]|nr:AMP-binding protein [Sphingomonadaceae bacterium]